MALIPYHPSPLFLLRSTGVGGGGGMGPCAPFSYASDSGAARICQRGAKAREQSDRAGESVSPPPPQSGREIFQRCIFAY